VNNNLFTSEFTHFTVKTVSGIVSSTRRGRVFSLFLIKVVRWVIQQLNPVGSDIMAINSPCPRAKLLDLDHLDYNILGPVFNYYI